jgi:hypothetical protein
MSGEFAFFRKEELVFENSELVHSLLSKTGAGCECWGCGRKGW